MNCPNCGFTSQERRWPGKCSVCAAPVEGLRHYCAVHAQEARRLAWRNYKARAKNGHTGRGGGWKEALAPTSIYSKKQYEMDVLSWYKKCQDCGDQFVYPPTHGGSMRRYCDKCQSARRRSA